MSTGYDYTKEKAASAEDFEISDAAVASERSADEIEQENSFDQIPPGTYELEIVGFLGAPKAERKEAMVDGKRVGYSTHSVIVKFALPDNKGCQVTDFMLLPPSDPVGLNAYLNGTNASGKAKGFLANKFYHFLERLGFVLPKGAPLPAEARRLGNWVGRRVVATVEAGDPYTKTDATTGEEKKLAGRNGIKLFSYRATEATQQGYQRPAPSQPAPQRKAAPAPQKSAPVTPPAPSPEQVIADLGQQIEAAIGAEDFALAMELKKKVTELRGAAPASRPAPQRQPAMAGAGDRGLSNI
jgi:hypothetical protein